MASHLACDADDLFAAVAPVSGLRFPSLCASKRPVPVIAFHGTADPVDPFAGHGQAYWTYGVPEAAQDWAKHDGCPTTSVATPTTSQVAETDFTGCAGGSEVRLYAITGEGHEWPGGPTMPKAITRALGPQSTAIDANDLMWAFFVAHPMR